ncbi:MAG: hypothetical protein IJT38_05630 [Clostridia bacterium]|nr:hypothetical protein [Clostridia bacterium]
MTENERTMLIETEQRSKSNSHRIDSIEEDIKEMKEENKAIYRIATSVEVMAEKLGNIEEKVDETKRKVDETAKAQRATEDRFLQRVAEIENAPAVQTAKNINEIKVKVITAIITFLVTGILGSIIYFAK